MGKWPWLPTYDYAELTYTASYAQACFGSILGSEQPLSQSLVTLIVGYLALGKYKLITGFDDWSGYLFNRAAVLDSISGASNAIVYGGDSHNGWAGHLRRDGSADQTIVAAEFDGMSVSSTGIGDRFGFLPQDLLVDGNVM